MQLDVVNNENKKIGSVDVRDDVFGGRVNTDLMWESVVHANELHGYFLPFFGFSTCATLSFLAVTALRTIT